MSLLNVFQASIKASQFDIALHLWLEQQLRKIIIECIYYMLLTEKRATWRNVLDFSDVRSSIATVLNICTAYSDSSSKRFLNCIPVTYSEPYETATMECFAKIVVAVNYFRKRFYLRCLAGFWIGVCMGYILTDNILG